MTALRFDGKGFEYFKIWIVNILLTIVTIGLYYPWAKVRNHRYFYANSTLEEQNFEYHATGKQLFIGYIISMVLLILYVGIQQVSPIGSLIVLAIFLLALPWILWRSLMFNMRITSFSNVRFGFDGTLGNAYINYMALPIVALVAIYGLPVATFILLSKSGIAGGLATALTISIILITFAVAITLSAFIKKKNMSYMINGSRYGQGRFSTQLTIAPFAVISLKTVGLFFLAFIGSIAVSIAASLASGLGSSLMSAATQVRDPAELQGAMQNPAVLIGIAITYAGFIILSLALFSYSHARQRAYIYSNTTLDNKISFKSTLGARQLAWVSISNLLLVIFTLGLATAWAKVRIARLTLENTHVDTSVGLHSYVTSKQNEQSSLGEQIGDAFDIDVGIGL